MLIATWNLERADTLRRQRETQRCMEEYDADVWVLTETRDSVSPGPGYRVAAHSRQRVGGELGERWVTIWTRLDVLQSELTGDPQFTTSASIAERSGRRVVVYGTVLPWCGSSWQNHGSAGALAYEAALQVQRNDWRPVADGDAALCVAGDFNQDLSNTHYYWSKKARAHLRRALADCKLTAVTAGERDPVRSLTEGAKACIDHICLSPQLASRAAPPVAKPPERNGHVLSDHPAVMVWLADV